MLLTDGFEAQVAFPVEPCVPVPWIYLEDWLELSAATIDAALHEGHGTSPLRCRCFLMVQAIRAVPRGRSFDGFRASFPACGAAVAFALNRSFRAHLFSGPGKVLRHRNLCYASFRSCRSFMQVLAAFATSLPV